MHENAGATVLAYPEESHEMIPARVELGVGPGDYTIQMVKENLGPVWAYDMFNGTFPASTLWDNEDTRLINAIAPQCNQGVKMGLEALGVTCVEGEFPATFWKSRPESVSFVRCDMDTYVTTIAALELFHRIMVPGGYFLIHDYAHGGLAGVGRAVAEFMEGPIGRHYEKSDNGDGQHLKIQKIQRRNDCSLTRLY